ncbi:MAG: FkbM family methyltransferase [Pseudomonadota bacterium]
MGLYHDFLAKISGNKLMQRFLAAQVRSMNHARGIGTSGDFSSDGEFVVFDLLRKNCQPPYCIFDVGSNSGQFLEHVLNGEKLTSFNIHCFEPSHETFKMLAANAPTDDRVKLNQLGLGKENCEAVLYYNVQGSEGASLTKRDLDHYGISIDHSETVRLTTLHDYCLTRGIEHIHLLKLDVEGHELDALIGAKDMIANHKVDVILFEFGGCNIDTRRFFRDYWHFFEDTPMDIFRTTPSGYLIKITAYKEDLEQFLYSNFVAIRRQ